MRFKTNLKAGILLYAMLMASVFLLVLQVYLSQMTQFHKEYQAQTAYVKARLMAEMIHQNPSQPSGHLSFKEGEATYTCRKGQQLIIIDLGHKRRYQFQYPKRTEEEAKENTSRTNSSHLAPSSPLN
ncbi:competence type IV pilus minor pilin ComGG [Streptococcus canis]|nr:competence type IV pilus minor pilin ComGG [Streptococcus canis]